MTCTCCLFHSWLMFLKFRRKGTFWPFKRGTPSTVKHFSLFCFFIGKGKIKLCCSGSQPFECIYSSSWWPLIWSLCGFIGSATHAAFIQRIKWILWIRRVTLSSTMCLEMWGIGSPCFLGNFGVQAFFLFFPFFNSWSLYASLFTFPFLFMFLCEYW